MSRMTISLNIHFRNHLTISELKQVIEELDERLKDLDTILKDLFEDDYDCVSVSIVKEVDAK